MALIYLYFVLAFLVAVMGAIRGRIGWRWFLIALFLSPLIAGILVLALPRQNREPQHRLAVRPPSSQTIPMPMDSTIRVFAPPADSDSGVFEIYVNGAHVGLVDPGRVADFPVPSGRLLVEASDQWATSRPVAVETMAGQRVDLEVSSGTIKPRPARWSIFERDPRPALRLVPGPTALGHAA